MKQEFLQRLDGYDDVIKEIEVCRKYGVDYTLQKGKVAACIDRFHPARLRLRVIDVSDETPTTKTFRLTSPDRALPPFQAGQYVALLLELDHVRTSRAYSISSPPHQTGYYEITVRRVPDGLVSTYLHDHIKSGDTVDVSGPTGHFHHNPIFHDDVLVFLAGGCGIAPFMSMIRETVQCGLDRTIYLFYGNRRADDVIFHEELARMASRFDHLHYVPVIEEEGGALRPAYPRRTGLITGDLIRQELGDVTGKTFYMCGPSAMYDFCGPELEKLGIPRRKIRRELYGRPRTISECPGWPDHVREDTTFQVTVNGRKTIPARAGNPLLNALEEGGFTVPSICRSGECSLCRVRLLSGAVFQPEGALLRASDRRFGYIHSCAAYPLEDLQVCL
jgi:ferredoxin-NADP reductase